MSVYKSIFWKYFFLKIGSSPKSSVFSTGSGTSTRQDSATSATGFVATGIIGKHNGETKRETTEKNEK